MTKYVSFPSLSIICLVLIASCGGGGGGSTPDPESSSTPSPTPTPGTDTAAPTLQLTLNTPVGKNTVDTSTITLSGIATDNLDIESILVNGQIATERFSLTASDNGRRIEWSVEQNLALGENLFDVTVVDSNGNTSAPESVTIHRTYITPTVLFDSPSEDEWIGYYHQSGLSDVLHFDKNTLEARETSRVSPSGSSQVDKLGPNGNIIYSVSASRQLNSAFIRATDINTNEETILKIVTLKFDSGQWTSSGIFYTGYRASDNSFYMLISYEHIDNGVQQSTIFKYSIDDNSITYIINENLDADPAFVANSLVVSENYILTVHNAEPGTLTQIDPNDGSQTVIADNINGELTVLAIDSAETFVYGLHYSHVTKINLETQEVDYFSFNQNFFNFSSPKTITIDETNNRLLVIEPSLGQIITVDIANGERGSLLNNNVGEGRTFIYPRDMVVTSDKQTAYVTDKARNVPAAIFEIELETGNRTEIIEMPWDISRVVPTSLALDDNRDRLFVATSDTIAQVNLVSGERTIIASTAVGSGESISTIESIEFDNVNQTLIILESTRILSLNVNTLDRVTLFDNLVEGSTALSFDHDNNRLLLLNNSLGAFAIDLETEAVTTLASECLDPSGDNTFNEDNESYGSIAYNANKNTLLIANNSLIEYDLDNDTCTFEDIVIRAATFDNDNSAIMLTERGVAHRDLTTGQNYIISR